MPKRSECSVHPVVLPSSGRSLRIRAHGIAVALGVMCFSVLLGCKDLTGSQSLPAGVNDPSFYNTPAGALGMRTAALYNLEKILPGYITDAGLITDELTSSSIGASLGTLLQSGLPPGGSYDERILPEQSSGDVADQDYGNLQGVRANIEQALGALAAYDTSVADTGTVKVRRGELYALLGYDEILLADLFCSGVPLSTFDFGKDFTYQPSSTRDQVYEDAIVQEDSALALAGSSSNGTQVRNVALVLQGRAWLDLGQYAKASQVVSAVPDQFQYQLAITGGKTVDQAGDSVPAGVISGTVANREGLNGLPFALGGDPRTAVINQELSSTGATVYYPARYNQGVFNPFTVADWIEARLIQAEAALQARDTTTWLALLNQLRATATVVGQSAAPLNQLSDPGSSSGDSARVALTFQERAYWLFLTGHRQGDLRRLLRQYKTIYKSQDQVYPTGPYTAPGTGVYGGDVTAAISNAEFTNPKYHGCIDRNP
jgi:hypothetical protein